jgi:hypothetical protein
MTMHFFSMQILATLLYASTLRKHYSNIPIHFALLGRRFNLFSPQEDNPSDNFIDICVIYQDKHAKE